MASRTGQTLYLIRRGERPDWHKAPYHEVIICDRKPIALWEAGWTGDGACVWTRISQRGSEGWLLQRWNGFDIDYGHVVRSFRLPDGTRAAFVHDPDREPWPLVTLATWWSLSPIPGWLAHSWGVRPPTDDFSLRRIAEAFRSVRRG